MQATNSAVTVDEAAAILNRDHKAIIEMIVLEQIRWQSVGGQTRVILTEELKALPEVRITRPRLSPRLAKPTAAPVPLQAPSLTRHQIRMAFMNPALPQGSSFGEDGSDWIGLPPLPVTIPAGWMSLHEAAGLLCRSARNVKRLAKQGRLEFRSVEGHTLIERNSVRIFLDIYG